MSSTQAVPALFAALVEEGLNNTMLLERVRWVAKEMKEKDTEKDELKKELSQTKSDWLVDKDARYEKEAELRDVSEKYKKRNMELLKLADSVTLRGALGKFCRNFGERTCEIINFQLGGSHLSLFPFTHNMPHSQRRFRDTRLRRLLILTGGPKSRKQIGILI